MERIKNQANRVSTLVFAPETGATYKKTLTLTWDILRETGLLVWLVLCLVFVGIDWFWNNSITLGRTARIWYTSLGEKPTSSDPSLTLTSQSLLDVGKSGAAYLLAQARQQLGLPQPEPSAVAPAPTRTVPPVAATPAPTPTPTPVVETAQPTSRVVADEADEL